MEEKKPINPLIGILSTALVVAICIIFMLATYMFKLSDEIKLLKGEKDISSTEDGTENSSKEMQFIQFDTTFGKIEDCAVEQIECATIADKVEYDFDVDADGTMDKLTVEIDKKGKKAVIFKVNGKEFENGQKMKGAKFFLVDLNKFDNTIEIVIFDEGEDGNPHYMIYSKSGSKVRLLEDIYGPELYLDGINKIAAVPNNAPKVSPIIFIEYYEFDSGKITSQNLSATRVKGTEFSASDEYFTENFDDIEELEKEIKKNSDISKEELYSKYDFAKLSVDDKFEIKSFTDDMDIEIELKDGRKGYILADHFSKGSIQKDIEN